LTPLHAAAEIGSLVLVDYLYQNGADIDATNDLFLQKDIHGLHCIGLFLWVTSMLHNI